MNKNYIYNNGTVTVIDENGNARPVEYSDNLEEILIQENLIEEMENKIQELEKSLENNKDNNKPYIPFILPTWFLSLIVSKPILTSFAGFDASLIVQTIFGPMNNFTLTTLVVGTLTLPLFAVMEKIYYNQIKHNKNEVIADAAEYDYLKNEIETQKEKLEEFKRDTTKTNGNSEFKVQNVNDIETLNNLKSWLILYSNLGYSIEKYYKLYENGKLEEYLKNEGYSEDACERAKEYIEEKGKTLVKRSKH